MKHFFSISFLVIAFLASGQKNIDPDAIEKKMQWFADAKLGIFIHWGIYAVNGVDESWSFYNNKIGYADYMKQLSGFTASNYDPEAWAELIESSGAQYAVITTKHHDGVSLYHSKAGDLNVVTKTPAKRDLLMPFFSELRKRNIKCGAYFSLIDWSHPDYPAFRKDSTRYLVADKAMKWKRFQRFFQAQIKEIGSQFNPDLWWFDGDWEHSAEEWQAETVRKEILQMNQNAIINGRLQGFGDYETPEQNFPVSRPDYPWWELCMTTNDNWGYKQHDTNWKTPYEVISIFSDVISYGGNLLLDIGPREDGTIPAEQVNILTELGKWNKKHYEAIFFTLPGLPNGHFYGPSTLSRDSTALYLFLPGKVTGDVLLKGLDSQIKKITVLGSGVSLTHKIVGKISWSPVPGLVFISVPLSLQDEYVTVLKVELDSRLKLYRGAGGLN